MSYRADPTLWHERIVLRHPGDGLYLVLTPDLEIQQEALRASTSNPLLAVRLIRDNGSILGVAREIIYFFEDNAGAISEAEIQEYITEAAGLALVLGYREVPFDPPWVGALGPAHAALGAPPGGGRLLACPCCPPAPCRAASWRQPCSAALLRAAGARATMEPASFAAMLRQVEAMVEGMVDFERATLAPLRMLSGWWPRLAATW